MAYRYERRKLGNIFKKELPISDSLKSKLYARFLTIDEYLSIKEQVPDSEVPLDYIIDTQLRIAEKFGGLEKVRGFDWKFLENSRVLDVLKNEVPADAEDVMATLYEKLKFELSIFDYSKGMKNYFKDMFFEIKEGDKKEAIKTEFNFGRLTLREIVADWELFKDKDISYCLKMDRYNTSGITQEQLHAFMEKYSMHAEVALELGNFNELMENVATKILEKDKQTEVDSYLAEFSEEALQKEGKQSFYGQIVSYTPEQYKYLLKHISIEDYLLKNGDKYSKHAFEKVVKEIKSLPENFVEEMPFPISKLTSYEVIRFIETYGLKNVVDFDNECGGFFSKNNCEMLDNMYAMFLHYGNNNYNPETSIYTKQDDSRDYYTKDEFYEAMRRMLLQGPSDGNYADKAPNYKDISGEFRTRNKDLFLADNARPELKELFYTKKLTSIVIAEHPEYVPFLKGHDLSKFFKQKYISVYDKDASDFYARTNNYNVYSYLIDNFGYEEAMKFIAERAYILDMVCDYNVSHFVAEGSQIAKEHSLEEIGFCLDKKLEGIIARTDMKYPEKIPDSTKANCPRMFLPEDADPKLKEMFYNRELTPEEFMKNPEIIKHTSNVEIGFGFDKKFSFLIGLFPNDDFAVANKKKLKVLDVYNKINDVTLQENFLEFIQKNAEGIDESKFDVAAELLQRISNSNANEVFAFRGEVARQLLETENPIKTFEDLEKVFLGKDLPVAGKLFAVFQLLNPNFDRLNGRNYQKLSPVLQHYQSSKMKRVILFSDLVKAALASNNRSLSEYIDFIEEGNQLYLQAKENSEEFESLPQDVKDKIERFRDCLVAMVSEIDPEKRGTFKSSGNVVEDIERFEKKFCKHPDKSLADELVFLFAGVGGISSVEESRNFAKKSIEEADKRGRRIAEQGLVIEQGDFVKGFNKRFFGEILQNGSVAKEFLGSSAGSDLTPLDTDLSLITAPVNGIEEAIGSTEASGYGSTYIILKKPDYNLTRTHDGESNPDYSDVKRPELFYTGVCDNDKSRHYGIRTGFASSEISAIVTKEYDQTLGLEIAMNGFYIPVTNLKGELIFTPQDFDNLRKKMGGLKRYGAEQFGASENLYAPDALKIAEQIEESERVTTHKRKIINKVISEAVEEMGLKLKSEIDGDLTAGFVELIDTGSTGRGTNKPGDGDFDFMMRVDKAILEDGTKLSMLKKKILEKLKVAEKGNMTASGDFRLKDISLEDVVVDIDITFCERSSNVSFSTDMALQQRIEAIKEQHPEKYKYIVSNILLAKQVLKKAGAYKPNRGEIPQGGLGGVGIENWVLQHGGSFYDAAKDFLSVAQGKSFEEFKSTYAIWDFGENHLAQRRGHFAHDNFVKGNMSEEGFLKMRDALQEYVKQLERQGSRINKAPDENYEQMTESE